MASVAQIKVPATYIRGGTSKGVFFRLQDLPAACQVPGAARDAFDRGAVLAMRHELTCGCVENLALGALHVPGHVQNSHLQRLRCKSAASVLR